MNDMLGIGIAIIAGYFLGKLFNKLKVPSVAGYVIAGLILGQSFIGLFTEDFLEKVGEISDFALALIAFGIGGELLFTDLKRIGKKVFTIAFLEAMMAFVLVTGTMLLLRLPVPTALLLGAVASATAPAATVMVINELKAKGPLTRTLIAVVAIDDAICLMIYAVASSVARVFIEHSTEIHWSQVMLKPLVEIGASIGVGVLIGGVLAIILNRISYSKEILAVTVAGILIALGTAMALDLSALLCNMAVGIMVANFSSQRQKAFSVVDSVSAPIYTAFFVMAGARLQVGMLLNVGLIGLVYTVARMVGKVSGASLGAVIAKAEPEVKKFIGFGLLSQIGVAVGLAIVISHEFAGTELGELIITVLLATTIITEIVGPLFTKLALKRSGEAGAADLEIAD